MMNEKGLYNIPILTCFGTCHNPLYYLLVVTMEYSRNADEAHIFVY